MMGAAKRIVKYTEKFRQQALSQSDYDLLLALHRLRYATANQLVYWVTPKRATVTKTINVLERCGLIQVERSSRPFILSLTPPGRRVIGQAGRDRRYISWSVMAHQCHRNEVEIKLRDTYSGFTIQSREYCYKKGLNPAHGEHLAKDHSDRVYFILLDDYLMGSDRIVHSWHRAHTPTRHWPGETMHWCSVADDYLVSTTSESQFVLHRTYALKQQINAKVLYIPPLWKNA